MRTRWACTALGNRSSLSSPLARGDRGMQGTAHSPASVPAVRDLRLAGVLVLASAIFGARFVGSQTVARPPMAPSSREINLFFGGQLSPAVGRALAAYPILVFHAVEEEPLAHYLTRRYPQVYRVLVGTRPHGVPVVVRLSIPTDGPAKATVKVGAREWLRGALAVNRTTAISPELAHEFLTLLKSSTFWSMPTTEPFAIRKVPMGGAEWILEGDTGTSYRVICRSTSGLGPLNAAAMLLVNKIGRVGLTSAATLPREGK